MGVPTRYVETSNRHAPSLPSPTLTNPDMVLPDRLPTSAVSSPSRAVRPPSPSYLVRQYGQGASYVDSPDQAKQNRYRPMSSRLAHQMPNTSQSQRPSIRSIAQKYSYDDAGYASGYASSPTIGTLATPAPKPSQLINQSKRHSIGMSSIASEDLEAMQIPDFVGVDSDTETLDDGELEVGTPNDVVYRSDHRKQSQTTSTLMRAELILANAKKRLIVMDQNLRDAREKVVPLTAANLKRATTLRNGEPSYYDSQAYRDRQEDRTIAIDMLGHSRVLSEPTTVSDYVKAPSDFRSRKPIPMPIKSSGLWISRRPPSWMVNGPGKARSHETLRRDMLSDITPRKVEEASSEHTAAGAAVSSPVPVRLRPASGRTPSTPQELRDQMQELKGRISNLRDRAKEDSLRRQSTHNLRKASVFTDAESPNHTERPSHVRAVSSNAELVQVPKSASPRSSCGVIETVSLPLHPGDGLKKSPARLLKRHSTSRGSARGSFRDFDFGTSSASPDEQSSDSAESTASTSTASTTVKEPLHRIPSVSSIYEDAPTEMQNGQRHEDRQDAFDYSTFFLHSALGTFSRPRGSSVSSSDSQQTAKGPDVFQQVPPTPETPDLLREVERIIHKRGVSNESIGTIATFETAFETAQEVPITGKQPLNPVAEWMSPQQRSISRMSPEQGRADSASSMSKHSSDESIISAPRSKSLLRSSLENKSSSGTLTPRTRSLTSKSQQGFAPAPPSPAAVAVSALADANARPLGLRDKALLFTLVESLRSVCEKLQTADEAEYDSHALRKRLDNARKALDGLTLVEP